MNRETDDRENRIEVKGVNSQGFGTVSKLVMRDRNLTPEAKAIYAYICSYAGSGCTAFPSVSLILADLGMSKPRYYKHRKQLEERGYITVFQGERQGSRYAHNVYRINQYLEISEDHGCVKALEKRDGKEVGRECADTPLALKCGKPQEPQVIEGSNIVTTQKTGNGKPQVDEESSFVASQNEHHQNVTANTNRFEKSVPNTNPLLHPSNQRMPPYFARSEEEAFERLCASSVQRNLLGNPEGITATKMAYGVLLEEGHRPVDIQAAWARRQSMAHEEKKKACHYPQLKKWLESDTVDGARAMLEEKLREEQSAKRKAYRMAVSELCDRDPTFAAKHAEASAIERAAAAGDMPRERATSAWRPIDEVIASFIETRKA